MKIEKKVISNLKKCYSIAPLQYKGKKHFLVAAEKTDRCLLFDEEGNQEDVIWEEPGGVMTMVQIPGTDGQFLATHKFYSPNDSKEAKIVAVSPSKDGTWNVSTLVELPFVHRFDILERNGVKYLLACALKSDHEQKDDWRFPGKVYAAVLPDDISGIDENHQLKLTVLKEGMLKNHGYTRDVQEGIMSGIVSCENGVYRFVPPANPQGEWEIETLLTEAASDAVLVDFDQDGEKELAVIAPFHGDRIRFYKKQAGEYRLQYEFGESREFLHSIYGGMVCGYPGLITGHRKGQRDLMLFTFDPAEKVYKMQYIDRDCGSANVYHFLKDETDYLVSTNREIDEVALYRITEDER